MRTIIGRGLLLAAICIGAWPVAVAMTTGPAKADGCGNTGWGGQCDFNFAPDGSHEHCDDAYGIPFVGNIHNCYWVNTHP
jgi:hypothetical protein